MEAFKIKNVKIANPFVLAPMEDITTQPFRILCKELGAGLVYSEMTNVNTVLHGKKDEKILEKERPISIQLAGNTEKELVAALEKIEKKADIIDLNMGCPSRNVMKAECGGFLMKDKEQALQVAKWAINSTTKPVTVKIRIGWKSSSEKIEEFARKLEDSGIAAIAVHGRTVEQGYSGKANWNPIKKVKAALSIPVIANGDISSPEAAKKCFEETNCDAVMIGRAAMKNPYIFSQCIQSFKTGKYAQVGKQEKLEFMRRYLQLSTRFDEKFALQKLHCVAIAFDFGNAAEFRLELSRTKTKEELEMLVEQHGKESAKFSTS